MKHTTHRIPRRLATVFFAFLLFAPGAARAAECPESSPEDPQERRRLAKEWFATAETAENIGNDVEATRAYACSYKMVAHPFTAFNLARVAERSGDTELALKMYKAYVALKPDAQDKEDVKAKIKAIEDKLAADKGGAGTETTPAPPTETATAEPPATPEPPADVLTPPPEPKPAEVVETQPEPEPTAPSHTLEWVVGGVSVAALLGGVVTNFIARAKMDTCRTDANNNQLAKANDECNAARPLAYTSYTLFGVAAAGIALDSVLIILHRVGRGGSASDDYDDSSDYGFMLVPGGGGLTARGRF
jgi:hypothetical protein